MRWWLLVLGALALAVAPAAGAASPPDEDRLTALTNATRVEHGLPALRTAPDLVAFARRHADRMAAGDRLHHSPDLATVEGWQRVGENVGRGFSVEHVHEMLLASASHRANVLGPQYLEIGIGATWKGDLVYVTQVFRRPALAAPQREAPSVAPSVPTTVTTWPSWRGEALEAVVLSARELARPAPRVGPVGPPLEPVHERSKALPAVAAAALIVLTLLGHARRPSSVDPRAGDRGRRDAVG